MIWILFDSKIDIHKNQKQLIIFFSSYIICIFLSGERTSFGLSLLYFIGIIIFLKQLRKIFSIALLALLFFIISLSLFKFGKSDPINRNFIKTFHQITNHYLIENNSQEIIKNDKKVRKKLKKK